MTTGLALGAVGAGGKPAIEFRQAEPVTSGEPVSVATGEYLETWRDFLVPAYLSLDGGRYMGLMLPQPPG